VEAGPLSDSACPAAGTLHHAVEVGVLVDGVVHLDLAATATSPFTTRRCRSEPTATLAHPCTRHDRSNLHPHQAIKPPQVADLHSWPTATAQKTESARVQKGCAPTGCGHAEPEQDGADLLHATAAPAFVPPCRVGSRPPFLAGGGGEGDRVQRVKKGGGAGASVEGRRARGMRRLGASGMRAGGALTRWGGAVRSPR
jgi:hypothetical protein